MDVELLRDLYVEQRLPTRQVARRLGVKHPVLLEALKEAGIERRAPIAEKLDPSDQTRVALGKLVALHRVDVLINAELVDAVRDARAVNASWSDIGLALGVTQSSAHGRFAPKIKGDQ